VVYVEDDDGRVAAGARVHAWVPEVEHIYGRYPVEVRVDNFGYAELLPEAAIPFPLVAGEWAIQVEGDLGYSEIHHFDVLPYAFEIAATRDTWEEGEFIELGLVPTAGNEPTAVLIPEGQFALVDDAGHDVFPPTWGQAAPNGIFAFINNVPPGLYTLEAWDRVSGLPAPIREIEILPVGQLALGVSRFPKFDINGQPLPPGQLFTAWDTYPSDQVETHFVMQNAQVNHGGGQFLVFPPNAFEPWQQEVFFDELSTLWFTGEPGVFYTAVRLDLPVGSVTSGWRRHLVLRHYW
jgi:hypothetical protein